MAFDITTDLDLALRLAKAADMETTARFRSADLHVETKPDMTPVSDADTAAEQSMLDLLAVERPDDAILAEESGASGDSTRTWILDPIDGTKQFVRGLPSWATLVALRENDDTLVAVVSAPALGRLWWAAKGQGAWSDDGKAIAVSGVTTLSESVLLHAELSGWDDVPGGPAKLVDLSRECWQSRGYGDFWIHCLVAEGAAEIAAEPGPSLWDLAAPALIVEEAGGRFTSLDGRDGPTHGSALATNGHLHDTVLSALNS
ncbi:MAG: histidinol phosphatase [Solirubrobacterales bacterium]|nr:histidinol phosphatase [Solirubrobacterales bacterium]